MSVASRARKRNIWPPNKSASGDRVPLAQLIPIRKSDSWWALSQDERRKIVEERSTHIQTGIKYLPAITRRLHHCRDLGTPEPFDFVTWFEFAPSDSPAFDRLVAQLRVSEEWKYVEREVDIRLIRDPE